MKSIIFLVLITFLVPLSSALEFYPSKFDFSLEKNDPVCRKVFFDLDGAATVKNEWAELSTQPWSVTGFNKDAEFHQIELFYPDSLEEDDEEIQFCISGSKPGTYKGALVIRQEREGSSIVQFVIWIQLEITGEPFITPVENPETTEEDNESESSSRSRRSSNRNSRIDEQVSNFPKEEPEPLAFNPPKDQEEISLQTEPSSQEESNNQMIVLMVLPTIIGIIILMILLSIKPKKKKK